MEKSTEKELTNKCKALQAKNAELLKENFDFQIIARQETATVVTSHTAQEIVDTINLSKSYKIISL